MDLVATRVEEDKENGTYAEPLFRLGGRWNLYNLNTREECHITISENRCLNRTTPTVRVSGYSADTEIDDIEKVERVFPFDIGEFQMKEDSSPYYDQVASSYQVMVYYTELRHTHL